MQPEMSAYEVTEEAVKRIESGAYDVIILNFANCDMVGHTGVYEAACKAATAVDTSVSTGWWKLPPTWAACLSLPPTTAMLNGCDEDGEPFTAHTTNLVPFYIVGADVSLRDGRLADIAPTMLDLMGLEKGDSDFVNGAEAFWPTAKTLMSGQLTCPEQIKRPGAPARRAAWGIGKARRDGRGDADCQLTFPFKGNGGEAVTGGMNPRPP